MVMPSGWRLRHSSGEPYAKYPFTLYPDAMCKTVAVIGSGLYICFEIA